MKISVIVPCYNAEKWIAQCIESIIQQTYMDLEIIVVDNESTDRTVEIVKKVQLSYPIRDYLIRLASAPNIYPNCWDEAREVGFSLATGEYFLTVCADDYLHPEFLENYVKLINGVKNPAVRAIQSPIKGVVDEKNKPKYFSPLQAHHYSSLEQFKSLCLSKCPVNTPTVMFHRSLYDEGLLKTMPELYGGAADYDLYCRLADKGVYIFPYPQWLGYYYRWHPGQATWKVLKSGKNYDAKIQDYWRNKWT